MLHTMLFQSNLSMRGSFSVESGRKPHRVFLRIRRGENGTCRYFPALAGLPYAAALFLYMYCKGENRHDLFYGGHPFRA